ncbi:hypothetical protein GBAR_LOCUS9385 [Geodia barretti]|uniref:Uncharacterized protein n=1 Tax=Geodia barretti TaxID=519541 RepID=A0AA35RNZ4_GEOBA|nr:hypothetical protein GBAR_LOCUS9385 [Geodia barretti]
MPPRKSRAKKTNEAEANMPVLTAYCTKLRRKVEMDQIELVTMKNGRPAAKGVAKEDPSLSVFRILSKAEAEELAKALS